MSVRCTRARQWACLLADAELSELERHMLRRHLASCAACHDWCGRMAVATELLRAAELEAPRRRIELPKQQPKLTVKRGLALVGVAAAAALGSVLGVVLGQPEDRPSEPLSPQFSLLPSDVPRVGPEEVEPEAPPAPPSRIRRESPV